jgi:hypothetical protein
MAATKSIIALGFASAMLLGASSPTWAGGAQARAQSEVTTPAHRHHQRSGYHDRAYVPNEYAPPASNRPNRQFDNPNQHDGQTWDPYGLRWDNTDG